MKKIVLLFITMVVLIGCSNEDKVNFTVISESNLVENNDVSIKELEYDEAIMDSTFSIFNKEELKNGLYMFNTSEDRSYILFRSEGVHYSNISFTIEEDVLKIKYDSEEDEGLGMNTLFLVEKNDENAYDTVDLQNNGKQDFFNVVFVGKANN
ncbi:hypothetical protein [Psychrobacillus sp.]|uniref:hypothetical protein n=1 Tax=Psychrobacillus sp. TaxID=1871623 RepID=UPI0028BF3327|nr:hypothetical protein [Psychrobacillus sp.]